MNAFPITYTDTQAEEVQNFIHRHFGESDFVCHEIDSEYIHTDSLVVHPQGKTCTLVTCGMGARAMNSPTDIKRIELVISAAPDTDAADRDGFLLAGEIAHISKYPFREDTWFQAGHTINASEDFKKRFGYDYFAFLDLGLSTTPTDMQDEVHFLALVPLYEEEREWVVNHNTFAFLTNLYDIHGDDIFRVDRPREVCIPDWDEEEQFFQLLMRELGIDRETVELLLERMAEAEENGAEITGELLIELLGDLLDDIPE